MKSNKEIVIKSNEKFIVITGASSGIGEACAYKLAKNQNNLLLIARRKKNLEAVKNKCLKLGSKKVFVLECDLTQVQKIEKKIKLKLRT